MSGTVEFVLDGGLRAKAQRWLDEPADAPVEQPAATVMLVRDVAAAAGVSAAREAGGVEVFVMRRVRTMAFAPDVTVFPGGRVDERDDDPALPWLGPAPDRWAALLGVDEALARRLLVSAAREVFEECGVLLAADADGREPDDVSGESWQQQRDALVRHEIGFADLLADRGLALRTDLLRARARWVTPQFESRRYDTFMFLARVPAGQSPDGRTSEAQTSGWERPADLLVQWDSGRIVLLPPTLHQVRWLATGGGVDALLAAPAPEPLPRVLPVPVRRGRDVVLVCAEDS
ncbi:NUDIX hydrolase [Piscicoccus intestinalis]|uniref:NUDIX hydrolase n=1 Tax=Piscicoccus intestinalis TaxID=746033 RepID=UPI000838EE28|nr:hypothetical protein [Piscicoccus intestinalis]